MIKKVGLGIISGLFVFHLVSFLFTGWYTVDETQQAVIEFRGKPIKEVTQSGLHMKLPFPYSKVIKVPMQTYSLQFGYSDETKDGENLNTDDAKMITGDENIVLADMVVQWKITEAKKYLYANDKPNTTLYNAASSSLRSVIGSSKIDDALTSGKAEIEQKVKEKLSSQLDLLDIGITITAVKLQDVELPNEDVRKAFTNVTDAREQMNTKINEAEKHKNEKINIAKGEKDAIISKANGDYTSRVEEAKGDTAVFNSLYKEYKSNSSITKERLILETMDEVLPKAQIYIMNDDGSTMKYLPIQALEKSSTKEGGK